MIRLIRFDCSTKYLLHGSDAHPLPQTHCRARHLAATRRAHFPVSSSQGRMGFGVGFGVLAVDRTRHGGLGCSAVEGTTVFEALGMGDIPLAGYLAIHNMVGYILSK